MHIGPYEISSPVFLAPMAGITDRPFRQLCRRMGAGLVVSEMVSSDPRLRNSRKTQLRLDHQGEQAPISVQIAGTEALQMADAARFNVVQGAQIIDINMGCPAKKVCNVMAGSALLKNEQKVQQILHAVVQAVDVPVTLKIRTGWDAENRNAVKIAHIAEAEGIQALAIHGRTRSCGYKGEAEYDTIAAVKHAINIPVIANGDITSPEKARWVLDKTGADAIMIGRGAQGNPWLIREIIHFLQTGTKLNRPSVDEQIDVIKNHLLDLYEFYGEYRGVRIARKHINGYCQHQQESMAFRKYLNKIDNVEQQLSEVVAFFNTQKQKYAA
ncbi:MAG: tRNA dihydrouridine synthase DusB [Gammaproteobacteria bacterium]|nr:tRNA dihydrouridine synthase DusB [Gammaproteobacteria bacterium]